MTTQYIANINTTPQSKEIQTKPTFDIYAKSATVAQTTRHVTKSTTKTKQKQNRQ